MEFNLLGFYIEITYINQYRIFIDIHIKWMEFISMKLKEIKLLKKVTYL